MRYLTSIDRHYQNTGRIREPLSDRVFMCFSAREHIELSNLSGGGFLFGVLIVKIRLPNHTQIANVFIENMADIPGGAVKVFLAISRKTIGWHKQSDRISYTQLAKMTGLSVNGLKDSIKRLIEAKLITQHTQGQGYVYDLCLETPSLNDRGVSLSDTAVSVSDRETVSLSDPTKETKKETIQKGDFLDTDYFTRKNIEESRKRRKAAI